MGRGPSSKIYFFVFNVPDIQSPTDFVRYQMRRIHLVIKDQKGSQSLIPLGNIQNIFLYHISEVVFDHQGDASHLMSNFFVSAVLLSFSSHTSSPEYISDYVSDCTKSDL